MQGVPGVQGVAAAAPTRGRRLMAMERTRTFCDNLLFS